MSDIPSPLILPEAFRQRMRSMLGNASEDFFASYESPRTYGLRINTSKISPENFLALVPFPVQPIPWVSKGYFYEENCRPSFCPFYQAGLYYLQEPSAMTPASRLPIEPGDYVLDLCAAPGGKASALADALNTTGFLLANDISAARAKALLRNLELTGNPNICVTSEPPSRLGEAFGKFFDKIMLDAPCSGEGMFRKEEALLADWSEEKSLELSKIQKELLETAVSMLRPGGMLLYSTCTFAPIEDEGAVSSVLEKHPEMHLLPIPGYEGFACGNPSWGNGNEELSRCVRIFPHRMQGEGHFLALLCKDGEAVKRPPLRPGKSGKNRCMPDKNTRTYMEEFFQDIHLKSLAGKPFDWNRVEVRKDKVYYLPLVPLDLRGIHFLRNGLYLGDLKKNRFEPSESFALALRREEADSVSLSVADERLSRYLKGEPIPLSPAELPKKKGWTLLCAEGYPLAFGKLVGETLKNKYPVGWRV